MSAALAILPRLRAVGADAELRGGRVILTHASIVSSDLLAELRARRADLLAELEASNKPCTVEQEERAAIQAEAHYATQPKRALNKLGYGMVCPTVNAPPKRQPSPYSGDATPTQGAWCGCCRSSRWWTEMQDPKGWRCHMCHPPAHLQAGHFRGGGHMSPVLITLHPARMGLFASKATERASCAVDGITYQAESRSGAICEICRVLMAANLPDAPWQAYRHDRLVVSGRSIHALSRRAVSETDKHGPRFTAWKPHPNTKDAEASKAMTVH